MMFWQIRRLAPYALWRRTGLLILALLALCASATARADEIKIGGTGAALGTMQQLADAYTRTHPGTRITVLPSMGSGGGIKALLAGAIQIAVSARPLKEAEVKAGAAQFEYGRTPFVFATPSNNRTAGLTTQELVSILSGKIEHWPDGRKIRLVLRPVGDSDGEVVKSISPEMRAAKESAEQRKGMAFAVTDQDSADGIEKIPGALGWSTLALIISEKRSIKALKWNDVEPSAATLADGSYPLYKQMFLITSDKAPSSAQQFLNFVRSAPGREILLQNGHWVK